MLMLMMLMGLVLLVGSDDAKALSRNACQHLQKSCSKTTSLFAVEERRQMNNFFLTKQFKIDGSP
jgi:hypothetical protein